MSAREGDPKNLQITPTARIIEVTSVFIFFACEALLLKRLWGNVELSAFGWCAVLVGSFLLADFVSGLFHWAADTWAAHDTPIVGALFVRPFREHHSDQLAITRHDYFETTGANCFVALPWFLIHFADLEGSAGWAVGAAFLGLFLGFVLLTSLSHRWAHSARPPMLIRALQRTGLLLSPEHHANHHRWPHADHYCITAGILNPLLDRTRFFRMLEVVVSSVLGLVPREDDARVAGKEPGMGVGTDDVVEGVIAPESPASKATT